MSQHLPDNDTSEKVFLEIQDRYDISINFSKWSRRKLPIKEVTFRDHLEVSNPTKVHFDFLQAIMCAPLMDPSGGYKNDLVLFVQETNGSSFPEDGFIQRLFINNFNSGEKINFVTVVYRIGETIPNSLDCQAYKDALDASQNGGGVIIPDTNNGGIIIKT